MKKKRAPNGSGSVSKTGYRYIGMNGAKKREHVLIAEGVLGYPLPAGVEVHHVDEVKTNNANTNLVICPSRKYHALLHQRMRARDACGNPSWRKCCRCGSYDAPENLSFSGTQAYHAACNREHVARMIKGKT